MFNYCVSIAQQLRLETWKPGEMPGNQFMMGTIALPFASNYVRQNLVLESISKLRASKITFDLGFRSRSFYYVGQFCWQLKIDGANMQLYYVKSCVKVWFGSWITITLRQKLRLIFLESFM